MEKPRLEIGSIVEIQNENGKIYGIVKEWENYSAMLTIYSKGKDIQVPMRGMRILEPEDIINIFIKEEIEV